jgi:hypothetical protein
MIKSIISYQLKLLKQLMILHINHGSDLSAVVKKKKAKKGRFRFNFNILEPYDIVMPAKS